LGHPGRKGLKEKRGAGRGLRLPRQRHCWGQWKLLGREKREVSLPTVSFILPVQILFVKKESP
jgi:hypothetical protein